MSIINYGSEFVFMKNSCKLVIVIYFVFEKFIFV